jgi:hypothetical protein
MQKYNSKMVVGGWLIFKVEMERILMVSESTVPPYQVPAR